jgi:tRNA pseudouridine55 synthase
MLYRREPRFRKVEAGFFFAPSAGSELLRATFAVMLTLLNPGVPFPDEYPAGAVLLVDKPLGWTSFDVVLKIRHHLSRRLGIKRIKIGHAGTLDPLATGLLVLCTGTYTRRIDEFQVAEKIYTGTITLGATTDSYDLEKPPLTTFPTAHLSDALLGAAAKQFVGHIEQVPPVFSAIKIDGKRVYKHARTGEEVDMPARPVHIRSLELSPLRPLDPTQLRTEARNVAAKGSPIWQHPDYAEGLQTDFRVVCGKGTYIRSLAFDLGEAVESGAYLSALRRTHTGGFGVADAWQISDLVAWCGQ